MSTAAPPDEMYPVMLRLVERFRFLHEPIPVSSPRALVGRDHDLAILVDRILYSDGGSFLVTGYRGVGKTSFVNRVLTELDGRLRTPSTNGEEHRLVPIHLNLAKPLPPWISCST